MMSKENNAGRKATEERVAFTADARLLSILGEQLIGSEKVGILELIKNAYDAGATRCTVTIEGVEGLQPSARSLKEYADLPGPVVEVRDDGRGMTHDDLIHGWLRPATSRRAAAKEQLRVEQEKAAARGTSGEFAALVRTLRESHGGRLPLGEKGVGRLATHRLGRHLWLRTKTASDPYEYELKINWDDFDSLEGKPTDLDAVPLTLRHQAPTTDYGARQEGTVLCCYGGRSGYRWTREAIVDAGRAVNAIRSPTKAPKGFEPIFVTPHASEPEMASPLERVHAPFELVALVGDSGLADIDITFDPPAAIAADVKPSRHTEKRDLREAFLKHWSESGGPKLRKPKCGQFLVHIRAWLRNSKWMGPDGATVTDYLDEFGGLTVFRDGLATLPAQQAARSDWLRLAREHIKKGSNISYYNMVGEVEIQQEFTLDLRDRSSREGMIETQPYLDLVALLRAVVGELQFQMQRVREEWSTREGVQRITPATLKKHVDLVATVTAAVVDGDDFQKDAAKIVKAVGGKKVAAQVSEAAGVLRKLSEQLALQEDERTSLLEAAGFGLAVGIGMHEIAKVASAVNAEARQAKKLLKTPDDPELSQTITSIQQRSEALLTEARRLAPLRLTRGERGQRVSMRAAIEAGRAIFVETMREAQVIFQIDGDDFFVQTRFGALAQVFANLFDNALYWIATQGGGGVLNVVLDPGARSVIVADSGPGIAKKIHPHLFEPFYSDKNPPSGLGLYICRHYLEQCRASIRLSREPERLKFRGAQFLLDFSRSPDLEKP